MILSRILELTEYGVVTGLVAPEDQVYTINRLMELLEIDDIEDAVFEEYAKRTPMTQETAEAALEDILEEMMDYAYAQGIMKENSIVYKDLFDTKIMGCLVARPSEIRARFKELYEKVSSLAATDYFYKLSCHSN